MIVLQLFTNLDQINLGHLILQFEGKLSQYLLHPSFFNLLKSSFPKLVQVVLLQKDYQFHYIQPTELLFKQELILRSYLPMEELDLPNHLMNHFEPMLQMMTQYQHHPSFFGYLMSSFPKEVLVVQLLLGYQYHYNQPNPLKLHFELKLRMLI